MVSAEANKAIIRRVFDEFVNQGDFSVVDEIYREDMIDHQPLPGAPEGLAGVKYTIAGLRGGFPDLQVTIEDMSAHADHVVIHNTWRGTHRGEFLGLAPTGKQISAKGVVVWRLQDGLIAERWGIGVDTSILAQLGVGKMGPRSRARVRAIDVPSVRTLPILPGRLDQWRQVHKELNEQRGEEYRAARQAAEISRELAWCRTGPDGDVAIYHMESPDPARSLRALASSTAAVDTWLRTTLTEVHGRDPWTENPPAAAELAHGWQR
ncbi:ester cyclase [Nocardia cyriacigeorgica]|uniref:ester cyclase n=1 Tax=Nocardia cyriacigeorgica TaxID=135487 RepID=UPI00189365EA|nr:ester cyclase [Nocardia cyriacigeorgica]MBF6086961.1 ester cyclase [Nocardia cyriacigeorgica]MBF6090716.1 ester cyclase [Nocardia cyriacigeorgica]MBF6395677.1 ester cyclase [Nocardia cyriacigeorgica]MBF6401309.1 ester cyclase [Nocardia cyriacigeorgica]